MATIATLAVNLIGNVSDLKSKLGEAQQAVQNVGKNLTNVGKGLSVGVTAPILGIAGAAIKAAADQEQLMVSFTTMLGSAEKAKTLMAELSEFSASTPFQLPEVNNAAKQLLAFGFAAEDLKPALTTLGDISAGLNIPLGDMAYLFGTSRAQGRLFTADINQFSSRGVPIIAALAKTMGVAESEVRGLVESGKVGFPELQKALGSLTAEGGQFSGLMEAQSQTMAGLFSTLQDNVGLALTEIGAQIVETFDLKTKLAGALEWLAAAKDALLNFAQTRPELFRLIVTLTAVAAAIGPILIGIGWLAGAFAAAMPVIGAIGGALGLLFSPIALVVAGIVALGVVLYRLNLGGFKDAVDGVVATIGDWVAAIPKAIAAFSEFGGGALNEVIAQLTGFGIETYDTTDSIRELAFALTGSWAVADLWSNAIFDAGSVTQGFIADVQNLASSFDTFISGTDFAAFNTTVTGAFGDIWQAVQDFFSGDISLSGLAGIISEKFGEIRQAVVDLFGGTDFSQFLTDINWDDFISKLTWENFIATLTDWGIWIADLAWDVWLVALDWADYIAALAWDAWLVAVDWAEWITPIAWDAIVTTLTDWGEWITSLDWTTIITTVIDWATWIPALSWTAFVATVEWSLYLVALAWDAFVGVVDWATYLFSLGWDSYVSEVDWTSFLSVLTWENFVSALNWVDYVVSFAWDSFITKLEWTGTLPKLESWGTYISNIDWGEWITSLDWTAIVIQMLDWATWIPALAWNGFVAVLEWAAYVNPPAWGTYISNLVWSRHVKEVDWNTFIADVLDWAVYVAFAWSDWIGAVLDWSTYVFSIVWGDFVEKLAWPDLGIDWGEFVPDLRWPDLSLDWGDFVPSFPGWSAFWSSVNPFGGGDTATGNALGTSYWAGGVTRVGEMGPETVILPRGSRIINDRQLAAAGAGGWGGPIAETIIVRSEQDIYDIAYRVSEIQARRRGGR